MRGGAVWQLVGLITRRSQVQILPPLPNDKRVPLGALFHLVVWVPGVEPRSTKRVSVLGGGALASDGSKTRESTERAKLAKAILPPLPNDKRVPLGALFHLEVWVPGVEPRSTKRVSVLGGGALAPTGRRPENRLGAIRANPAPATNIKGKGLTSVSPSAFTLGCAHKTPSFGSSVTWPSNACR